MLILQIINKYNITPSCMYNHTVFSCFATYFVISWLLMLLNSELIIM